MYNKLQRAILRQYKNLEVEPGVPIRLPEGYEREAFMLVMEFGKLTYRPAEKTTLLEPELWICPVYVPVSVGYDYEALVQFLAANTGVQFWSFRVEDYEEQEVRLAAWRLELRDALLEGEELERGRTMVEDVAAAREQLREKAVAAGFVCMDASKHAELFTRRTP